MPLHFLLAGSFSELQAACKPGNYHLIKKKFSNSLSVDSSKIKLLSQNLYCFQRCLFGLV